MYCVKCGHEISPGARYCSQCGARNIAYRGPDTGTGTGTGGGTGGKKPGTSSTAWTGVLGARNPRRPKRRHSLRHLLRRLYLFIRRKISWRNPTELFIRIMTLIFIVSAIWLVIWFGRIGLYEGFGETIRYESTTETTENVQEDDGS